MLILLYQDFDYHNFTPTSIIYSDSAYCVNIINDWMFSWERNGWKRPKNQEIKEYLQQYTIKYLYSLKTTSPVYFLKSLYHKRTMLYQRNGKISRSLKGL